LKTEIGDDWLIRSAHMATATML